MGYCVKCGNEIKEGFVFCPACGTKAVIPADIVSEVVVADVNGADNLDITKSASMSAGDLLNYIRMAASMEKGYYKLNEICDNIQSNINELNRKANEARQQQNKKAPQPPVEPIDYSNDEYHIKMAREPDMSGSDMGEALKAIFLPAVWIAGEVKKKHDEIEKAKEKLKSQYNNEYKQYLAAKEDFPRKLQAHNTYVQTKINEEKTVLLNIQELNKVKADVEKQMSKAKLNMQTFYSEDVLYPKYRGLIPVLMFCEYLESGRCDNIKECINAYEEDVKYRDIVTKLEDIVDAEYDKQRTICELISSVNYGMRQISNALYDVNNQINIAKYNMQVQTECQKQMNENLNAIKWYEDVKFIKSSM